MKELYLFRLFRNSPWLAAAILFFIGMQAYLNTKGNASFPWYIWDMYSHPQPLPERYSQHEFYLDNQRINLTSLPIWQEATLLNTLDRYLTLKDQTNDPLDSLVRKRSRYFPEFISTYVSRRVMNTPEDIMAYPGWLKRYIETQVSGKPVNELRIVRQSYVLQNGKWLQEKDNAVNLLIIR